MNIVFLLIATIFPILAGLAAWLVHPDLSLANVAFVWWVVSPAYAFLSILFSYQTGRMDERAVRSKPAAAPSATIISGSGTTEVN